MRTLGKRVKGNLSGVQIPYPPPESSVLGYKEMKMKMKLKSMLVAILVLLSITTTGIAQAYESPQIVSFSASKTELDLSDPDMSITFEIVATHPKGIENTSINLNLTNSNAFSISVALKRQDSPINYALQRVTFRGTLTVPRSVEPGNYQYSADEIRSNLDTGARMSTGRINSPVNRDLKGAETGILIRSNGYLNLDYQTINGPAYGLQNNVTYSNTPKYLGVAAPIWKVGETFNPLDYFEVTIVGADLKIQSFTPKICSVRLNLLDLLSEGECQFRVFTSKSFNYLEQSVPQNVFITAARKPQILNIEAVKRLKFTSFPINLVLSPVYASGANTVENIIPESITTDICGPSGYSVRIIKAGICTLSYKANGNTEYLPSALYKQSFLITSDGNVDEVPTPTPTVTPTPKKTITCVKGTKISKKTGVSPKCPKGYKVKK